MKSIPSVAGKVSYPQRSPWLGRAGAGLALGITACAIVQPVMAETRMAPASVTNIGSAASGARIVYQSSAFEDSASYNANNLIDGQVYDDVRKTGSFGWVSKQYDPVHREQVTIALPGDKTWRIGKIVLNPASNAIPERWAKDIEVQVANDINGPYRIASEITLRRDPVDQSFLLFPTEARFVRLEFRSNWGSDQSVALGEVQIFEAIDTTKPLGMLISEFEQACSELKQYRAIQIQQANGSQRSAGAKTASATTAGGANKAVAVKQGATLKNAITDKPATPARSGGNTVTKTAPRTPVDSVPARQNTRDHLHGSALETDAQASVQLVQLLSSKNERLYPIAAENIAAKANGGRIADVSSVFEKSPDYSPENLIDGSNFAAGDVPEHDKGTKGWASDAFSPAEKPQFVTVGFKDDSTHVIGKIVLNPSSDQLSMRWATRVQVDVSTVSPTKGPWSSVAVLPLRLEAVNQEFFIQPVEAKFVRFTFLANGPGDFQLPKQPAGVSSDRSVALGEIEIYEISNQGDQLDAVIERLNRVLLGLKQLNETGTVKTATMPAPAKANPDRVETVDLLDQVLRSMATTTNSGTM